MGDLDDKQGGLRHMGGKTRRSKALLPIPTVQTAQALVRLYGRLKRELSEASAGEDVLIPVSDVNLHMSRIIGLMPLLGIDFDPEAVTTVKTRVQVGPLKWGNLRSGTLTVLRHWGDWMTYRAIADALLARNRKAQALDVALMSKFVQKPGGPRHPARAGAPVGPLVAHPAAPVTGRAAQAGDAGAAGGAPRALWCCLPATAARCEHCINPRVLTSCARR